MSRRSSIKAMMTRNRRSVMMVTACTQTLIQGLDMDIIRMTSDQLTTCQEAQDFMIQHFGQLKDKYVPFVYQDSICFLCPVRHDRRDIIFPGCP